uniref:Uncharacterized protein n=1 Tax=Fagus sylvatica TaxID=28930 RepID=A0A2N9G9F4_FAGSY
MGPSAERLVEFPVVIFAFAIKWREKQVDPDLASKKSGCRSLERKIRRTPQLRATLIAKRNTEDENQRKEDDKDTNEGENRRDIPTPTECGRVVLTVEEDLSLEGTGGYLLGNNTGLTPKIAPDRVRFDLQRMEKKSNETFKKEYAQRIEDALKTKKIVDMTALMALAEQAAKKAPTKRKEGDVQMNREETTEDQGKSSRLSPGNRYNPQAYSSHLAPTQARQPRKPRKPTDAGKAGRTTNPMAQNRWPRKEPRQFTPLPMPMTELYPILIEKSLISPIVPKQTLQRRPAKKGFRFQPKFGLRFPLWGSGTTLLKIADSSSTEASGREEGTTRESIAWRRLFYTFGEAEEHITPTPLDAPPGPPSTGTHVNITVNRGERAQPRLLRRVAQPREASCAKNPPSLVRSIWMNRHGQKMTPDEWRDGSHRILPIPVLDNATWVLTPEFETRMGIRRSICKSTARRWPHLENELLRVFREPVETNCCLPYIIPDPGVGEVIVEIKEEPSVLSLPALTEEEEKGVKAPPLNLITTATTEEEDAGPMVEGLSIHTITEEEDSTTTPPTRHCQQGEEPKMRAIATAYNSDEEIEFDILEALERQDEGSKPNIEELEIVNLANEGEEPREVKIGTRCAAEQKEALSHFPESLIGKCAYRDLNESPKDKHPVGNSMGYPSFPDLQKYGEKMALHLENELLMISVFPESLSLLLRWFKMRAEEESSLEPLPPSPRPLLKKKSHIGEPLCMMSCLESVSPRKIARRTAPSHLSASHGHSLPRSMIHHEIEKYQLRLNPKSNVPSASTSGKLLGFIVSGRGIEIDPANLVQAIRSMPAPITRRPQRIPRVSAQPTHLWFLETKFLQDVPPHYLYMLRPSPQTSIHGLLMLGQAQDETGKKEPKAIYYLSKKLFTEFLSTPETRYLLVVKDVLRTGLGLQEAETVHALLHHLVFLVSRYNQIKMDKTAFVTHWGTFVYDVMYMKNAGATFSEPCDANGEIVEEDNQGRWKLYFDGAANAVGSGIGAVLVSPKGQQTPIAVKLGFDCTNNMTEYEACIVGLQAALEFGAYELEVFGDSLLIVSQTNGEWQARDPKLIPYQRYISRLIPKFKYVTFTYTPRAHNHFADALATLASLIKLVEGDDVRPLRIETRDIPAYCVCIEECMNVEAEIDDKPWYYDIKRFIQDREYPSRATENEKKYIRRMAFQFFLSGEILYKRTHDATLLRCVDAEEANQLIQEMHAGLMGAHANGPFLARKIMRAGYYWLTMERDCIRHVQTCHKCQMYQNSKNAPPQYLHTMASPWPFSAWGMDVIGAITPKASNGHEFILVAIDYFTKWVEACSFKNVTQVAVTRFVKNNIICRYGMPEMLITDNASNLNNRMMDQLCQQFKIQHHNSAPYRPKMNGAVEAANKNVKKILSKMTETYKDWHEHLPYALCAYRTSVRTSVGATPYSLVYGMEAVLPVEVEIPSLRILSQTQLEEAEWAQARYEQLNFIDEKRLAALCHGQLYQRRIERAYNKKARPRTFQPGDLVLKKRNMALSDPRGKFAPSYEGPYVVKKAFSGGAIILADMDGEEFRSPINSDSVIKYHV